MSGLMSVAIREACAVAWDEGFKQGGPMCDVNYDDPSAHRRNPYRTEPTPRPPVEPFIPVVTAVTLEPPCAFLNANDRLHYRTRATRTRAWREAATGTLGDTDWTHHYERAHVTVTYRFPNNRRREVSNLQPTSKAIVDGLVDAGLIPDDDDTHVVGPDNRREYPNGPARVTVTIQELP